MQRLKDGKKIATSDFYGSWVPSENNEKKNKTTTRTRTALQLIGGVARGKSKGLKRDITI